jgi:hypothetical protein
MLPHRQMDSLQSGKNIQAFLAMDSIQQSMSVDRMPNEMHSSMGMNII